jgi:hypothetical protein
MSESRSWILDVRQRLESPPPRPASGAVSRLVVVVPLFVVDASLCTLFTVHRRAERDAATGLGLLGAPLEPGEERWAGGARVARLQLGLDAAKVLRLGDLDPVAGLEGSEILPGVAAVPVPGAGEEPSSLAPGLLAAPLVALRRSAERLLEETGEVYPVLRLEASADEPAAELWGPPASIVANLLERLGLDR